MPAALIPPRALAPDFILPDHGGGAFRLQDHLGMSPFLIVFFRGHWCPYCRRYLTKLALHWPRFEERSARVAAISPEPSATSRGLVEELNLPFPILSDADGQTIDAYGTRNGFRANRALLPHPSVFLLDRAGEIRFRSIDRNYKRRTTIRTLLTAIDALPHG